MTVAQLNDHTERLSWISPHSSPRSHRLARGRNKMLLTFIWNQATFSSPHPKKRNEQAIMLENFSLKNEVQERIPGWTIILETSSCWKARSDAIVKGGGGIHFLPLLIYGHICLGEGTEVIVMFSRGFPPPPSKLVTKEAVKEKKTRWIYDSKQGSAGLFTKVMCL